MKRMSMCMDVESAIKHHSKKNPRKWSGATDKGRKVSNAEFLDYLFAEHTKGHKVIPMNGKCNNPCEQSNKCKGFDYSGDGCPGYEVEGDSNA